MVFSRGITLIGNGRLSSAVEIDGYTHFYIESDGTITCKYLDASTGKSASSAVISYADDYVRSENFECARSHNKVEVAKLYT